MLYAFSRTPKRISQSSAETKYYAAFDVCCEALFLQKRAELSWTVTQTWQSLVTQRMHRNHKPLRRWPRSAIWRHVLSGFRKLLLNADQPMEACILSTWDRKLTQDPVRLRHNVHVVEYGWYCAQHPTHTGFLARVNLGR